LQSRRHHHHWSAAPPTHLRLDDLLRQKEDPDVNAMANGTAAEEEPLIGAGPGAGAGAGADTTADASAFASQGERSWADALRAFCHRNLGLLLVFVAQMFASIMAMTTRLLATSFETKFHALQIIFVRMLFTGLIGSAYMWYKQVPGFPLGPRQVRGLLIIRGMAGSIGLFGLYYSLSFLDISDATVITFLIPILTAFVCWLALGEPFTIKEASAGLIAFVGVLFIARPAFLFPKSPDANHPRAAEAVGESGILPPVEATPAQRTVAVACAILGAFAAATAYATIRIIGKRAHSLVSVNYFAVLATVMSFSILLIHPDLQFQIPQTPVQWALLASIGVSGFLLQVLLTEGLQREKAGRATNLIYTQLVFALIIERVVWGTVPPASSLIGSVFVIGAALWVSMQKNKPAEPPKPSNDEEDRLLNRDR
jgi:drug/metabolite transporter (DMT)-like permease